MALEENDIKDALEALIRETMVDLYGATEGNLIPIVTFWAMGYKLGEAVNLMKIPSGSRMGEIHGWMIGTSGLDRKRPDVKEDVFEAAAKGRLKILGANKRDMLSEYRIWCFKEYDPSGTETNASNSENKLVKELKAVARKLDEHPVLGLTEPTLQGHTSIRFPVIDTWSTIDHLVRIAKGEMQVLYYEPITGNDRTSF